MAVRVAVVGRRIVGLSLVLAGVMLLCCPDALALDPALDVSQYAHTSWKIREGFTKGQITSIAQTPDGYLWLGTEFGLYRFDGVQSVPWQPPAGEQLPSNYIRNLLVARDGTLWIATLKGLASWKDGKLTNYPEVAGQILFSLLEDREGTVWFGANAPGKLCAIQGGKVQCNGAGSFGDFVNALYEDSKGRLWVLAQTGLWRWKPGPPEHYPLPGNLNAQALIEGNNGALLLGTVKGLTQFAGGRIQNYALPGITGKFTPSRFLRSGDGSLWIGGHQEGLLHLHEGKTDTFGAADGLSGDAVDSIFEDREGSVWISTMTGLDRFREYAVPGIPLRQGLSNSPALSAQAAQDGSIWVGTANGLNRWQNGRLTVYGRGSGPSQNPRKDEGGPSISGAVREIANNGLAGTPRSLGLDEKGRLWVSTADAVFYLEGGRFMRVHGVSGGAIYGIAADTHGKEWISNGELGLYYWSPGGAVQQIPWSRFGQRPFGALALAPDRLQGGVWLGFYEGGITYFNNTQVRASYSAADGLGNGRVTDLRFGSRGTLWAATEGGLSRIRDGRVLTLTSKNGLPCDTVHWSAEDDDHFVWVYMPCGLARVARSELDAWVSDSGRKVKLTVFDTFDGVASVGVFGGYGPRVTKAPDGKIWFVHLDGVSVIDPRHLPFNKLPPPVQIEQVIADRKNYYDSASTVTGDANRRLPIPALTRDLQIDYTALSLVVPEKVFFKYKLEGWDHDWQDAGNRRQAFYTNLPPRKYRFRVKACNNSGVWNEAGAFLDFTVAPAYYQTWWFRLSCVAAFLGVLWGLYQQRLRQLAREFNAGVDARVGERTRIARELHDSLLQGVQGLMFRLQAVRELLPGNPGEAMKALDTALERGDKVIVEGRDTVSDLRQSVMVGSDIGEALTALGEELAAQSDNGSVPCVRVLVEGKQRELDPVLRDEVYRLGREALRNAFRHARAQKIEAEITYGDSEFVFHVRDDGIGIPPEVAGQGARAGHWGLPGMRERAKSFGGKLEVWSEQGAGTEIELTVPAAISYGTSGARRKSWFFRKKI